MVQIEKGIKPPARKKADQYPRLADLEIGDSFICQRGDIDFIRTAYMNERRNDKQLNYAARKIEEPPYNYRVWRTEPARFVNLK